MKPLWKDLTVYQIDPGFAKTWDAWETSLLRQRFSPLMAGEESTAGFVDPETHLPTLRSDEETFIRRYRQREGIVFAVLGEKRTVPGEVLAREVAARVKQIRDTENRPVKKAERDAIKEEAKRSLLRVAFSRFSVCYGYVDLARDLILVGSTNKTTVSTVTALLRTALGSLPIYHWATREDPMDSIRRWVLGGPDAGEPEGVCLAGPVEVVDEDRSGVWKGTGPEDDYILTPLQEGMKLHRCGVQITDNQGLPRLSFNLHDGLLIKGMQPGDYLLQKRDADMGEGGPDWGADMHLWVGETLEMLDSIEGWFGGRTRDVPRSLITAKEHQIDIQV